MLNTYHRQRVPPRHWPSPRPAGEAYEHHSSKMTRNKKTTDQSKPARGLGPKPHATQLIAEIILFPLGKAAVAVVPEGLPAGRRGDCFLHLKACLCRAGGSLFPVRFRV